MTANKRRVDRARMEAAMKAAGYARKNALARVVGCWPSQIKHWLDGDNAPAGPNLERLCAALGVTPAHLFGEPETATADALVRDAERLLGAAQSRCVRLVTQLTDEEAGRLAEHLDGWVSATVASRHPAVRFPVDDDREAATRELREESPRLDVVRRSRPRR